MQEALCPWALESSLTRDLARTLETQDLGKKGPVMMLTRVLLPTLSNAKQLECYTLGVHM